MWPFVRCNAFRPPDLPVPNPNLHFPPDPPYPQGGIVYSNAVTTVSPTYANEVLNGGAAGWLRETFSRPEVGTEGKRVCAGH